MFSNGEFEQHEQLTQKITFSATYTIFMNQIFSENAIYTVFSRFLGSFRRFALKNFSPFFEKNLEKIFQEKILKVTPMPRIEPTPYGIASIRSNHCFTLPLLKERLKSKNLKLKLKNLKPSLANLT